MAVLFGCSFLVSGLGGAGLHNLLMRKYRKYRLFLIIGMAGFTISYFALFLEAKMENNLAAIVAAGFLGFFQLPLRSHDIAYMCEVAYPVSEALICGLSAVLYSLVSLGVVLGSAIYFDYADANGIFTYGIASSAVLGLCIIFAALVKGLIFQVFITPIIEDLRKTAKDEVLANSHNTTEPAKDKLNDEMKTKGEHNNKTSPEKVTPKPEDTHAAAADVVIAVEKDSEFDFNKEHSERPLGEKPRPSDADSTKRISELTMASPEKDRPSIEIKSKGKAE